MFGDIDKKLIKYFKRKEESPFSILIKCIKKESRKDKETEDKKSKYKNKYNDYNME